MKISAEQRFWRKVDVGDPDQCWEWKGAKLPAGYGRFNAGNGKCVYTHRYSYELINGPIPSDMCVMHACDNPKCVNPAHLFVGTTRENVDDKVRKNRQLKGEDNGFAKLSSDDVREIRSLRKAGTRVKDLVAMFGVSYQQIWVITTRKQWSHVE